MFVLMKIWRVTRHPATPMIMHSIQPGKNEPSKLMDGAPSQPGKTAKPSTAAIRSETWPLAP
jgi:hypothetical protein